MIRRGIIRFVAVGVAVAGLLFAGVVSATEHGHGAAKGMAPAEAMKLLREGNERYVTGKRCANPGVDAAAREVLTKGQAPFAVVLGCADSRVPPEIIFDQGLGKLFVVRVAGNLIDPALLGSIEYAALHCGTRLIVVLTHESCGAVTATVGACQHPEAKCESACIEDLVKRLRPAVEKAQAEKLQGKDLIEEASVLNARMVAEQITAQSPALADLAKKGELRIVPAKYSLTPGKVEFLK
ncbi:MAG: carbonic anhydrase [Pseudomonadota bacterium]